VCEPYWVKKESLYKDLCNLSPILHVDTFVLLGGEPLLHPDVLEMAEMARDTGIGDKVAIVTNGMLLDKQPEQFWTTFDEVRFSDYGKVSLEQKERWSGLAKKYNVKLKTISVKEFYKPFTHGKLSAEKAMESWVSCTDRYHCATVQDGFYYLCPRSWQVPDKLLHIDPTTDGIAIEGLTEDGLVAFRNKMPMSCSYCVQPHTNGVVFEKWRECSRADWMKESGHGLL